MYSITVTIGHEAGLHLRPAALFVRTASRFEATVQVRNESRGTAFVNAKSMLAIATLGVSQGHRITIQAEGADAAEALEAIHRLIDGNFVDTGADLPA